MVNMSGFKNSGMDEQTAILCMCGEQLDLAGAIEHIEHCIEKHKENGEFEKAEYKAQIKSWLLELKHYKEKELGETLEHHTSDPDAHKGEY